MAAFSALVISMLSWQNECRHLKRPVRLERPCNWQIEPFRDRPKKLLGFVRTDENVVNIPN
jgi:hypothetical protein